MNRGRARVLLVGVGGLGCPAALVLARAGVGSITIADDDVVEETNLHRQILFDEADVGAPKAETAAASLGRIATHPDFRARAVGSRFLPHNAVQLARSADVVVEGSDNFATKFLVADACAIARVPVVHAAAVRWGGTVLAVGPRGAPCYRCLFEDIPRENVPNCADAGVIGPMVGVIGAIQADLALALIDGDPVEGTLVTFDGLSDSLRRRIIPSRDDCALCGRAPSIEGIDPSRYEAGDDCFDDATASSQIIIET